MTAKYRFTFSEQFLLTANLRYRRQIAWRKPFYGFKGVLALILLGLGALLAAKVQTWLLIPFAAIAGSLSAGWPVDAWLLKRRFRKSPYHNDEICLTLSEEGLHGTGRTSETRLGWPIFTKARRFEDGLLLFHGPQMFNWLPDSAATDPTTVAEADRLIRMHIRDFRDA